MEEKKEDKIYDVKFNEVFLEQLKGFIQNVYIEHKVVRFSSLDYLLSYVEEITNRAKLIEKE